MDVTGPVAAAINAWLAGLADAVLGPALRAAAALVVFAAVAANLSLHFAGALIAVGNLLVATVLARPGTDGAALLGSLLGGPAAAHDVLGVLVALATAALAVVLVCVAVVRDLALVVAVALAPLALATYALPQCDLVARTWVRLVVALVFAQLVQVVALEVGSAVIGGADGALFPASPLVAGVLAATLLYVLVRVPLIALDVALRTSVAVVPFVQPLVVGLRALRG